MDPTFRADGRDFHYNATRGSTPISDWNSSHPSSQPQQSQYPSPEAPTGLFQGQVFTNNPLSNQNQVETYKYPTYPAFQLGSPNPDESYSHQTHMQGSSLATHSANHDSEVPLSGNHEDRSDVILNRGNWSERDSFTLINFLQKTQDRTSSARITENVWDNLKDQFDDPAKKRNRSCKSHWTNLLRKYNDIKWLIQEVPGFSWDEERQMIVGENQAWLFAIEKKKGIASLKRQPHFPFFRAIIKLRRDKLRPNPEYYNDGALENFNDQDFEAFGDQHPIHDDGNGTSEEFNDHDMVGPELRRPNSVSKRHSQSIVSDKELLPAKRHRISSANFNKAYDEGRYSARGDIQATVDSTVEGQAQMKVLEDGILTEDGQYFMFRLLADSPSMARSYLAIYYRENLRARWLRDIITEAGGVVEASFTD